MPPMVVVWTTKVLKNNADPFYQVEGLFFSQHKYRRCEHVEQGFDVGAKPCLNSAGQTQVVPS